MNQESKQRAIVLLSGGIDSSSVLFCAREEGYDIFALSFDYHQRHQRELLSARLVAKAAGVRQHLVIAFDLSSIGGSALTSDMEVPKINNRIEETGKPFEIPVTYVPARNTIFLSFALSWAEVLKASTIFIGANVVDYSGYPDCRPEYLKAFEAMANLATKASVENKILFSFKAPFISLKKSDIIRRGAELGLDYSLTWSCYDPQLAGDMASEPSISSFVPCRRCESCYIREKGFHDAGLKDPLKA